MDKLFVTKHVNKYIRKDLNKSVRNDIYEVLNEKIKNILDEASIRAERDNRVTIMAKDI